MSDYNITSFYLLVLGLTSAYYGSILPLLGLVYVDEIKYLNQIAKEHIHGYTN